MILKLAKSPYLLLFSSVILLATSGVEVFNELEEDFEPGAHHGLIIFSVTQLLRIFPEIMHGLEQMAEAKELSHEKKSKNSNYLKKNSPQKKNITLEIIVLILSTLIIFLASY